MEIVDLRKRLDLIPEYVELRNKYISELMSVPVTLESTNKWMSNHDALMIGVVSTQGELIGACVIYKERNNELAIFVKHPGYGIGKFVIDNMTSLCIEYGIKRIWARTKDNNLIAKKFFNKEFEVNNSYGTYTREIWD